jgi:hypothetical protein
VEKYSDRWDHSHYEEETEGKNEANIGPDPQKQPEESHETEPLGSSR